MSKFSDEQIYQEVSNIVRQYKILQCDKCAKAVIKWVKENRIEGTVIKLKTKNPRKEPYILSKRLESQGITESITDNGTHYGVEVSGRVFDNLSTEGMIREDWINDFLCPSMQLIVEELEDL